MSEQGQQRHRRSLLRRHFGQQQQQPPRRGLRQRPPRSVVGKDVPALQVRDHPGSQPAIRGDQRGAPGGNFQSLPDQQGNRLCLFFGMGAFHQPDAGKAALIGLQRDPACTALGRQKQIGNRLAALCRGGRHSRAMPGIDLSPVHAHAVQQQFKMVLRVRQCITLAKRRITLTRRYSGTAERLPDVIAESQVKVGQDHRAARQFGHDLQQTSKGGRGTGHPRRDDWVLRRRLAPAPRRMGKQAIAPLWRVDLAPLGQLRQPARLDPGKSTGRSLPVAGQIADDPGNALVQQVAQFEPFDREPVHRPPGLESQPEQARSLGGVLSQFLA